MQQLCASTQLPVGTVKSLSLVSSYPETLFTMISRISRVLNVLPYVLWFAAKTGTKH